MPEYIPSPRQWVRDQVELYEKSGGTEGTTLRDTGLPVIIVTHRGNKSGAIRKTPLMKVKDGARYVRRARKPRLGVQPSREPVGRDPRLDPEPADAGPRGDRRWRAGTPLEWAGSATKTGIFRVVFAWYSL